MTREQLERRLTDLEREVAELRVERKPSRSDKVIRKTFEMFAEDRAFGEIVRLGREYRESRVGP